MTKITLHHDHTITYFSVYDQRWHRHANIAGVPAQEIAAMPEPVRSQVIAAQDAARPPLSRRYRVKPCCGESGEAFATVEESVEDYALNSGFEGAGEAVAAAWEQIAPITVEDGQSWLEAFHAALPPHARLCTGHLDQDWSPGYVSATIWEEEDDEDVQ